MSEFWSNYSAVVLIIAAVVILFIILIKNISIVQQSRAYVIERLGAFSAVWEVGIHFKIPFIERIAKRVSLRSRFWITRPSPSLQKTMSPCRSTPWSISRSPTRSSTPTAWSIR